MVFTITYYRRCGVVVINILKIWNNVGSVLPTAPSISIFKNNVISLIRSPGNAMCGIFDPIGTNYLVRGQSDMSAVPCGNRRDYVNSTVFSYLDHGDSKKMSENRCNLRKSGPEPWPLKVGGANNKMYDKESNHPSLER